MTIRLRDHLPQRPGLHGTEGYLLCGVSPQRKKFVLNPQTILDTDEIERLQIRPFSGEGCHLGSASSVSFEPFLPCMSFFIPIGQGTGSSCGAWIIYGIRQTVDQALERTVHGPVRGKREREIGSWGEIGGTI